MSDGQWYWCLEHHRVEPYDGCKAADRLGPYATEQEAAHALDISRERNEAFDNDPRWNDDRDGDGDTDEDDRGSNWNPLG